MKVKGGTNKSLVPLEPVLPSIRTSLWVWLLTMTPATVLTIGNEMTVKQWKENSRVITAFTNGLMECSERPSFRRDGSSERFCHNGLDYVTHYVEPDGTSCYVAFDDETGESTTDCNQSIGVQTLKAPCQHGRDSATGLISRICGEEYRTDSWIDSAGRQCNRYTSPDYEWKECNTYDTLDTTAAQPEPSQMSQPQIQLPIQPEPSQMQPPIQLPMYVQVSCAVFILSPLIFGYIVSDWYDTRGIQRRIDVQQQRIDVLQQGRIGAQQYMMNVVINGVPDPTINQYLIHLGLLTRQAQVDPEADAKPNPGGIAPPYQRGGGLQQIDEVDFEVDIDTVEEKVVLTIKDDILLQLRKSLETAGKIDAVLKSSFEKLIANTNLSAALINSFMEPVQKIAYSFLLK